MTLVVARQIDGDIYFVADTKFSAVEHMSTSSADQYIGGLKLVILNPAVCVAFAGNTAIAQDAIQGIYSKAIDHFDKNEVINYFLSHHRRSLDLGPNNEVDFVLAFSLETAAGEYLKELFRIAGGEVHWDNEATYVGDHAAFELFQTAFHDEHAIPDGPMFQLTRLGSESRPALDAHLTAALRAMQVVIDSTSIASVDGIRTAVVSEEGRFHYVTGVMLRGTPTPVCANPGSSLTFGEAADGSDHKQVGVGASPNCAVMGVYSYTGRFGIVYRPVTDFRPLIVRGCSLEQFQEKLGDARSTAEQALRQCEAAYVLRSLPGPMK
jgi:hypothetical protein